jgi:hypothetical protein
MTNLKPYAFVNSENIITNIAVFNSEDESLITSICLANGGVFYKLVENDNNACIGAEWTGTKFKSPQPSSDSTWIENAISGKWLAPKPFESWTLDSDNLEWIAPVAKPDSGYWSWDEDSTSWVEYSEPSE